MSGLARAHRQRATADAREIGILAVEPGAARVRARRAHRLLERLVGLIAQPIPPTGSGLWIEPCRAVHTFGVRGPLDLVFVAKSGAVLRVCENVEPGRMRGALRARAVLELRAGEASRLHMRPGTVVRWILDRKKGDE